MLVDGVLESHERIVLAIELGGLIVETSADSRDHILAEDTRTHVVVIHLDASTHIAHQFSNSLSRLAARRVIVGVYHGVPVEGSACRNGLHMVMTR